MLRTGRSSSGERPVDRHAHAFAQLTHRQFFGRHRRKPFISGEVSWVEFLPSPHSTFSSSRSQARAQRARRAIQFSERRRRRPRRRCRQCRTQATGHVLEDRPEVRTALGYSVQPVHWTGALALITLVFTVQPVQVAQSSASTHHTPHTTHQHHTPHTTALLRRSLLLVGLVVVV